MVTNSVMLRLSLNNLCLLSAKHEVPVRRTIHWGLPSVNAPKSRTSCKSCQKNLEFQKAKQFWFFFMVDLTPAPLLR
ncbi:MAG: hypothetical protein C0407_16915 [Desulfobacca sp.]|nr:hypothetical protein [Desulfobacca sp.]